MVSRNSQWEGEKKLDVVNILQIKEKSLSVCVGACVPVCMCVSVCVLPVSLSSSHHTQEFKPHLAES